MVDLVIDVLGNRLHRQIIGGEMPSEPENKISLSSVNYLEALVMLVPISIRSDIQFPTNMPLFGRVLMVILWWK